MHPLVLAALAAPTVSAPVLDVVDDIAVVLSYPVPSGAATAEGRRRAAVDPRRLARDLVDLGVDAATLQVDVGELLAVGLAPAAERRAAWFVGLGDELTRAGVEVALQPVAAKAVGAPAGTVDVGAIARAFAAEILPPPRADAGPMYALDAPSIDGRALFALWLDEVGAGRPIRLELELDPATGSLVEPARARLAALVTRVEATFGRDVLRTAVERGGATLAASSAQPGNEPARVLDGDAVSHWAPEAGEDVEGGALSWVEFKLAEPVRFDRVWIECAEGPTLGSVERFRVLHAGEDGKWLLSASGRRIGRRLVLPATEATTRRVRLAIDAASGPVGIARFGLFLSPPAVTIEPPGGVSLSQVPVTLRTREGATVRYTLDGSEPNRASPEADGPLRIAKTATLRARAFDGRGPSPDVASADFKIVAPEDWFDGIAFVRAPDPGLTVEVFEGVFDTVVALDATEPIARKGVLGFDVEAHRTRAERVALRYTGYVRVPEDGLYTFATASDDGSRVHLHDRLVVDNDGNHGVRRAEGKVALRAGFHPITVTWFNGRGPGRLDVRVSGPGIGRDVLVPPSALFR